MMTALSAYDRLEAAGFWQPSADGERREVFVSMGDATLAIYDRTERPLAHWSLPAVERQNPGRRPARYTPGSDAVESLEIDDDTMIEAFDRLHRSIARGRPRRGRVRMAILSLATLGLAALVAFWLPDALIRHAVAVMPPAVRDETGARLLERIARITGAPCGEEDPVARRALDDLAERVLGFFGGSLVVVPGGIGTAEHLPGGIILLDRAVLEGNESAEPVAGYILAEIARAAEIDPMERLLRLSGTAAALRLLTTGEIPERTLDAYAGALVRTPPDPLPTERLRALFDITAIDPAPYAAALGDEAAGILTAAGGAAATPEVRAPVLNDGEWVALQSICGD